MICYCFVAFVTPEDRIKGERFYRFKTPPQFYIKGC